MQALRLSVFITWLTFTLCAGLCWAGNPTIESPAFPPPTQPYRAPIQTGTARSAVVEHSGVYQLPEGQSPPCCLGRPLFIFDNDKAFVRGLDDFYTGRTVIWSGPLTIEGEPGELPLPSPQAFVRTGAAFIGLFRAERDEAFQHNYLKECAPNWYYPKAFDIIGERRDENGERHPNPVTVEVPVLSPVAQGTGIVRIALNANAAQGKENSLSVNVNGVPLFENLTWSGPGYRIISQSIDIEQLKDGLNTVELIGDPVYVKYLDWVEIEVPCIPVLRDGALTVQAVADASIRMTGVRYALDITDAGRETALPTPADDTNAYSLHAGRYYYFTDHADPLTFGAEVTLAKPSLTGTDYLCVGMREMLPALEPLFAQKTQAGLHPASVAFEDVMNVYNGGMYGPGGIPTLLEQVKPAYLLIAGGFHRDCRQREPQHAQDAEFQPGIPAEMRHVEQLTISDDLFSLNQSIKVGRVPAQTPEALAAWAQKAARHTPPDSAILLAGQNKKVDFSRYQRAFWGQLPSVFIEAEGAEQDAVRKQLFAMMNAGSRLVLYQGHAQSWELDKGLLTGAHAADMPVSDWGLATCNGAYIHADFEVYARDWMLALSGGCVNVMACSSVGSDDQQDLVVGKFIKHLMQQPDEDWGGMMVYLKRNLPLDEKTLQDPALPNFIKSNIERDRKTIDALMLLGDPSARIWAENRREATFQPVEDVLPPGPINLMITLKGTWEQKNVLMVEWRPANQSGPQSESSAPEPAWSTLPMKTPLNTGENPVTFDGEAAGQDGGIIEMRIIETDSQRVWSTLRVMQEPRAVPAPFVRIIQKQPQENSVEEPMWVCFANLRVPKKKTTVIDGQFQFRNSKQPETVMEETEWLSPPRHRHAPVPAGESYEIRGRCRKNGVEGPWTEWQPFVPGNKDPGPAAGTEAP